MIIQRQYSVTVSAAISRKIDTQNNKSGTVHQQDRYKRATTLTTACKTGTRHQQDKDERETTVKTASNGSAFYVTSKLVTK